MSIYQRNTFTTDIRLGERYLDAQTGIEGVATAACFFQHACERVTLELVVQGKLEEYIFDSPRLTHIDSGRTATTTRTGGPRSQPGRPKGLSR